MAFLKRLPATAALGLLLGLGVPTFAEASHRHGRSCGHGGYGQGGYYNSYRPSYSYSYRYRPPVRYVYVPPPVYYAPSYRPYYPRYVHGSHCGYDRYGRHHHTGVSVRIGFGW